jgi:uncharacterized protein YggE
MKIFQKLSKLIGILILIAVFYVLTKYSLLKWGSLRIESDATISVNGAYTMQIQNQVATYTIGINSTDASKDKAFNDVKTKAEKLIAALSEYGIPENDMQTQGMNVYQREEPYYENGVQKFKKTDWYANTSVSVTVRDVTKVEDFSNKVYAMDISDINGPYFSLDFNQDKDSELLMKAMDNAESKAKQLAQYKNMKLGEVVSITEEDIQGLAVPMFDKAMGGGGGSGIQSGSTSITKAVTVKYKLY